MGVEHGPSVVREQGLREKIATVSCLENFSPGDIIS